MPVDSYVAIARSGSQFFHSKAELTGKCELVRGARTGLLPELK